MIELQPGFHNHSSNLVTSKGEVVGGWKWRKIYPDQGFTVSPEVHETHGELQTNPCKKKHFQLRWSMLNRLWGRNPLVILYYVRQQVRYRVFSLQLPLLTWGSLSPTGVATGCYFYTPKTWHGAWKTWRGAWTCPLCKGECIYATFWIPW